MNTTIALVVLSGGQDSVTCLGVALKNYATVEAIAFSYGQRHEIELRQAQKICDDYNVPLTIMTIPSLKQIGDSALIGNEGDVSDSHPLNPKLPASFVPNRNALFLTTAHAFAQHIGATQIYTGVCQTDYSGYPDCRLQFIQALELTLNIGYETNIEIQTPLMYLNKAETFKLAADMGILEAVINDSHTCYNGDRDTVHDWGHGCGKCPACTLRAAGYSKYIEGDLT